MPNKTNHITYLSIAQSVLNKHQKPLRVHEIVSYAQEDGLFTDDMFSKTPQKSMQARISMDILNNGESSIFVRVAPGVFYLRSLHKNTLTEDKFDFLRYPRGRRKQYYPRRPAKTKEKTLVVDSDDALRILPFQGLRTDDGRLLEQILNCELNYTPRIEAENTEKFKQIITYTVISHKNKILNFERGKFNRAAKFLRGQKCIGFGGHVTEDDLSIFSTEDHGIRENALREIGEELTLRDSSKLPLPDQLKLYGIISDNSSEVGRKHIAVVFRYEVEDWDIWENVTAGEKSINQLEWVDATERTLKLGEYEYWSQLCWRSMFPNVRRAQAEFLIVRKRPFQQRHLLLVCGAIGSGKSEICRYLSDEYGYEGVNSGAVLADLLGVLPVPNTPRDDFQEAAIKFLECDQGHEKFANGLVEAISKCHSEKQLIDGVRLLKTFELIRDNSPLPIAMIFVYTPPEVAYDRYQKREKQHELVDRDLDETKFFQIYSAGSEVEVPYLMTYADAVIYNWPGIQDLHGTIGAMAGELRLKKL